MISTFAADSGLEGDVDLHSQIIHIGQNDILDDFI